MPSTFGKTQSVAGVVACCKMALSSTMTWSRAASDPHTDPDPTLTLSTHTLRQTLTVTQSPHAGRCRAAGGPRDACSTARPVLTQGPGSARRPAAPRPGWPPSRLSPPAGRPPTRRAAWTGTPVHPPQQTFTQKPWILAGLTTISHDLSLMQADCDACRTKVESEQARMRISAMALDVSGEGMGCMQHFQFNGMCRSAAPISLL